ncbi:MAG: glycerophosphodiester phosphodiesterase family protein [Sulfitobacter sp.]
MTLPASFYRIPFAHRALHDVTAGRPENSRAAIHAAIDAGYGIEIDVQLSADNAAMVFHDYALERLTEASGAVRLQTSADLERIALTGAQEGIPCLPEVLELIAGRVPLVIELKDQDGSMGRNIGPLEEATAGALGSYSGDVAVMSFNPHTVAHMAELLPDTPRGLVTSAYRYADWPLSKTTCDHLRDIPDYDRVGASFISHEVNDLARPRVSELKRAGAMICCWTVRDAQTEEQARQVADNITFEGYHAQLRA